MSNSDHALIGIRCSAIISAYYLGTSLYPEAKTYRLLADILNDVALVLDSLSPHLSTLAFDLVYGSHLPFISLTLARRPGPLRAVALCLSGVFRAVCGVVAGGSKAALTLHFAQPASDKATGDVGDLSAKDGSKETVLALLGMLVSTIAYFHLTFHRGHSFCSKCGSALMPYITDAWTTYTLLIVLVISHILVNYAAVRGVVLRSLNRQRAGLLWTAYRCDPTKSTYLTPTSVAKEELIFSQSSELYDTAGGTSRRRVTGYCRIGTPLSTILLGANRQMSWGRWTTSRPAKWAKDLTSAQVLILFDEFSSENFIVWLSPEIPSQSFPVLHIVLKEGHAPSDHLKAWVLATEFASLLNAHEKNKGTISEQTFEAILPTLQKARRTVESTYPGFLEAIGREGWDLGAAAGGFVTGLPTTISIENGVQEDKKSK